LRALTRERKQREMGSEAPFELIAQADGRLTLHDPATGKRVELESFGPTNAANFSRLLALPARSTP
jgi:putative photosynthetic complex assembly protein